ncbi:hypothetical protein LCGC14_1163670 [marine sediment metagenome]|uniref:PhoD-like phosphatase metallophosphatase domain-containing protein n=1 Tax=marine sediment metagenome TaxID=412755 RepID=A0A0F9LWY5_9ZZZZ
MVLKRRRFLRNIGLVVPMLVSPFNTILANYKLGKHASKKDSDVSFKHHFGKAYDRIWIGKSFWSVPMEDWGIKNDRLEFSGTMRKARLHLLTHVLKGEGNFILKGESGLLTQNGDNGSVGFTVGIKDETDPESIKAACYYGQGVSVGISTQGTMFIAEKEVQLPPAFDYQKFELQLEVSSERTKNEFRLSALDQNGQKTGMTYRYTGELEGLIAVENNVYQKGGNTFWWNSIALEGSKVKHMPENSFGPVLWAMYTISRHTLKLTAQLPPVGPKDSQEVELQFLKEGKWKKEAISGIDPVSFTAIFNFPEWDSSSDIPYRLVYSVDGKSHNYDGTVRREPSDRPLRFGGLTCQHWQGYPYRPLVENLEKSNPDVLYFSGDQLYEGNGGYPIKRQPEDSAILNYLGKWYMFGWAFGNIMRDRPTICTPDDHDVYQGNLWGEGGKPISLEQWERAADAKGGFVQTPKMVNVVNRTQCGHLPDIVNSATLPSGMTTWYSHLVYGRISFAIVSDRAFKSGPEMVRNGEGRIDHITERPEPGELESDELIFLGERQLDFLRDWATDWNGADMKVLLSQTLFANVGTHHGPEKQFLFGDMDSGGWPKSQRDEVLKIMRQACAFHINGDQHLPFMVQYSVDNPRDGGWTFCTPAISTGYPRWGQPDLVNKPFFDRPDHNLPNTGCYKDIFGNDNYIYAVGNPVDDFEGEKNRYVKCQKKSSGFGMVTFDQTERTIKMEAFRFLADIDRDSEENCFPGWPLTINQMDNDGRRPFGYLPRLQLKRSDQILKIINEDTEELVLSMRIKGNSFIPAIFDLAKYTLIIGEAEHEKTMTGIEISSDPNSVITV